MLNKTHAAATSKSRIDLTDKQLAFAREYVVDYNATQAAIRAGYAQNSAKQQGSRLLTNVDVQAEIRRLTQAKIEQTEVDAAYLMTELRRQYQMATENGKGSDALRALELLGKMIGAWQADRQQTVTAEDRLAAFEQGISIEEYLRRNRPH